MSKTAAPLAQVTLAYRVVGDQAKTHVFTAEELPGFHIGSSSLHKAFDQAILALGERVSHMCGKEVCYSPAMTFDEFRARVESRELSIVDSLSSKFVVANRRDAAHA